MRELIIMYIIQTMGFIEDLLRQKQKESFDLQQRLDEEKRAEQKSNYERINEERIIKSDRFLAIGFFNQSIIPRLLIEYKKNIDAYAYILIGTNYPDHELKEWPLIDKKMITDDYIRRGDNKADTSSVEVELRWHISSSGDNYNYIGFRYRPNGDIEVDSANGKSRVPVRKWMYDQEAQNKILEKAFHHPKSYERDTTEHGGRS